MIGIYGKDYPDPLAPRRVRLTPASAIRPRPVRWAWTGRLPVGELALTPGHGGIGKSTFHTWLVAAITRGTLPGAYLGDPRVCVIAAEEDSWDRTIVPRLIAAGADLDRVHRADVVTVEGDEMSLTLPRDCQDLEAEVVRVGAVLLSVDPLLSTIAGGLDTHKDWDVRQALQPLVRLADRTDCAVLGNAHFGKGSGSDPLALVMGSVAFGNVVRAALAFARDTEADDDSVIISQAKNNLGRLDLPSLRFTIESAFVDTDDGPAEVGRLVWLGETDRTVADILRDRRGRGEGQPDVADAAEWLQVFLTDTAGFGYAPAAEVLAAGEAAGFAKHTLQRARRRAGIRTHKADFGGGWVWALPGSEGDDGAEDDTQGDEGYRGQRVSSTSPSASPSGPDGARSCVLCDQSFVPEHPSRIVCPRCGPVVAGGSS